MDTVRPISCYTTEVLKYTSHSIKEMSEIGVYSITSISTGKRYVGSTTIESTENNTKGFLNRWRNHIHRLNKNNHHSIHLQNHVNKYGIEDLKFEVLEVTDICTCRKKEKVWLDFYNSYYTGFNCSLNTEANIAGKSHHKYIDKDDDILTLYKQGLSMREIGKLLGISSHKVSSVLSLEGISPDNHLTILPLKEIYYRNILGKEKFKDLAKEYNVPISTIYRQLKKANFTKKEDINISYVEKAILDTGKITVFFSKIPVHFSIYYRAINKLTYENN